jgi:hypothetical protein
MAITRYSSGVVVADRDPTALDDQMSGYNVNTLWRNSETLQCWTSTSDAEKEAVWSKHAVLPADAAAYDLLFLDADGAVDTLAIGTAGQVLKVNAGANGYEWAADAVV